MWDKNSSTLKGTSQEAKQINALIESIHHKINQTILFFQFQDKEVDFDEFISMLLGKKKERARMLIKIFEDHEQFSEPI